MRRIRIVNEFGIISSGWSARWDHGLLNVLRRSENLRFSSYWTDIGQCGSELREIACFRKGQTVSIKDSDSFFEELDDKIHALESINDNHPLTSDIAVARLKRYIVKDEYKILLHELFQNQVDDFMSRVRIKDDPGLTPDHTHLFPILSYYNHCFEQLLPLIIEGIYWSKEEHYYLFVELLKRISSPPVRPTEKYCPDTLRLQYFPSLLALYSIGLTALQKQNYSLINSCFNLKVLASEVGHSDRNSIIAIVHPCIIGSDIMNRVLSSRIMTPMSDYLSKSLKNHFVNGSFSEEEFEDLFDFFEYLLSLNYYYIVAQKLGRDWAPWGQFQWRNFYSSRNRTNLITSWLIDAEKLHEEWLPLKQGMFDGSYENFCNTKTNLSAFLKTVHLD